MQVRIFKPTRSAMQSAAGSDSWLLEFVAQPKSQFKETLGRTSSSDVASEVKITFRTLEEAISFAQRKFYSYEVIKPKEAKTFHKNYASNFS